MKFVRNKRTKKVYEVIGKVKFLRRRDNNDTKNQ